MFAEKAQVATEYIVITGFILIAITIIFTYSYISNSQSMKANQAAYAMDTLANKADLVYAWGPDNNLFAKIILPSGVTSVQDITLCNNGESDHDIDCTLGDRDGVKAGAIEMTIDLIGGPATIRRSAKAEVEMNGLNWKAIGDGPGEYTYSFPIGQGVYNVKVFWCGEKICLKVMGV